MKLVEITFPAVMKMEQIARISIDASSVCLEGLQKTVFDLFWERMKDIEFPHGIPSQVTFKRREGGEIRSTEELRDYLYTDDNLSIIFFKGHP